MQEVINLYDSLIAENNDPVHDPKPLCDYMDKWYGEEFIGDMRLDKGKTVLEIGSDSRQLKLSTVKAVEI